MTSSMLIGWLAHFLPNRHNLIPNISNILCQDSVLLLECGSFFNSQWQKRVFNCQVSEVSNQCLYSLVWWLCVPGVLPWTGHPLLTCLITGHWTVYKNLPLPVIGYGHLPIKEHSFRPTTVMWGHTPTEGSNYQWQKNRWLIPEFKSSKRSFMSVQ